MEQKTDLQIAQELKEGLILFRSCLLSAEENNWSGEIVFYKANILKSLEEVKTNLEGLGCRKPIIINYKLWDKNDNSSTSVCGRYNFCPDCLAKGVDKAKVIYEGILNLNSEKSEEVEKYE